MFSCWLSSVFLFFFSSSDSIQFSLRFIEFHFILSNRKFQTIEYKTKKMEFRATRVLYSNEWMVLWTWIEWNNWANNNSCNMNSTDRNEYYTQTITRTTSATATLTNNKSKLNEIQLARTRAYDAKKCICLFQYMKLQLSRAGHPKNESTHISIYIRTRERQSERERVKTETIRFWMAVD